MIKQNKALLGLFIVLLNSVLVDGMQTGTVLIDLVPLELRNTSVEEAVKAGNLDLALLETIRRKMPDTSFITTLLERGANPNAEMTGSTLPLIAAQSENKWDVLVLLLRYGADMTKSSMGRNNPFTQAKQDKNIAALKVYLQYITDKARALPVTAAQQTKDALLYQAVTHQAKDAVKTLLEKGANPTWKSPDDMSPLEAAQLAVKMRVARLPEVMGQDPKEIVTLLEQALTRK